MYTLVCTSVEMAYTSVGVVVPYVPHSAPLAPCGHLLWLHVVFLAHTRRKASLNACVCPERAVVPRTQA